MRLIFSGLLPALSASAAITGVASKIVQNDTSVADNGVVVVLCVRSCRSMAEATTISLSN